VLVLSTASAFAGNSVPDWVKSAAAEKVMVDRKDEAVVLLEETTLNVQPNGKTTEKIRRVVKILRPEGRRYGNVVIPFNSDSKINYLHVWSIAPDGHEYAMKDSEVIEVGRQEWGILYQDLRMKVAEAPGRDVNGIIAYEYEQKMPGYLSEDSWEIQESVPKHIERYTINLPAGWEYKASWHQHKEIEPISSGSSATWELRDEPALDLHDVPAPPPWRALRARAVISYFGGGAQRQSGDWRAIGAFYQQLAQDRAQPTPEITAKAQQLVAGKTDFADKAEAIAEYVQHTRYVAIEIGIGGLQPHPAAQIFHSDSGDCKDKATLLAAMLSAVGIHSTWVMVDSDRGYVTPDLPSMSGDHMIAAIQLPGGYSSPRLHSLVTTKSGKHFLIFDPTSTYTPFGTLEPILQGGYGILVDGNDSQLIPLPVIPADLNTVTRTANFKLEDDGSLSGKVTEVRSGDIAADWRGLYQQSSEKEQRKEMVRSLGPDLGDFTLGSSTVENTSTLSKDFIQKFDVTVPAYARQSGPLLLVRPRVFGRDSMTLDRKIRTIPIDLDETRTVKDDFDIELPPGYVVDELPEPVAVDMGFAAYQSRTELHGSTLHYARQCTIRELELPADKYQALQHFIGAIEQDERSQAVFKKKEGS
jgi:hypothetical protein